MSELDSSRNPCQDFEGFVNAKWRADNPIPLDRSAWGAIYQLQEDSLNVQHEIVEAAARNAAQAKPGSIEQKIGWLYASGMDEDAIEKAGFTPIKPKLLKIAALESVSDVVGYLVQTFADGDLQVFDFISYADFKDARMRIAYAQQKCGWLSSPDRCRQSPGLGLPTRDYYLDDKYQKIRDAYLSYIGKTLELIGVPADDAKQQAAQVLSFETELARASFSPAELRQPENQYHFVTIAEADQVTPHFHWETFFAAQDVSVGKGFSLSQPKFFAEFDKLLAEAPVEQWRAYLRFHVIDNASPYLSRTFSDNKFEFYGKTLSGQPEQPLRWKRVLEVGNDSMGEGLGQLYVARVFKPETKQRALALVDNIRAALKVRIENLDWMSDETKAKAIAKWNTFLPKIGYPDEGKWRDWSGLEIKSGDYYGNIRAAARFNYRYDISRIGKPADRLEWFTTPQTVNAFYNPTDNTLNFPAAILQPPYFYADSDDAINYGAIGVVMAHEAIHGFDDQGSQFDGDGNLANWWTPEDRAKFNARAEKLVQQYNEYAPIPGRPDAHVNGKLTLGENIADLGGFSIAYDALQTALKQNPPEAGAKIDGYTEDQRFFLSGARAMRANVREQAALRQLNTNPHAPWSVRLVGAASNVDAFAAAFQCKAGDAMVRTGDKQVKIW